MEEKINIAEILKNKPRGTKLYDWLHNIDVELDTISTTDTETVVWCTNETNNNTTCHRGYSEFGTERGYPDGLQILFPSKEMRDWAKFSWKKGDVLVNSSGFKLFFDRWANDDYTRFFGKVNLLENSFSYETEKYTLASKYETLDTLEIEKPEFKDGDIAFADYGNRQDVFIVSGRTGLSEGYSSFISMDLSSLTLSIACRTSFFKKDLCKLRLATEEEKQQLFDALEKEVKAWDAEKKQIVDIKKELQFKPFEKVLVRDSYDDMWRASFFSHIKEDDGRYVTTCITWRFCIPYEGNEHLLGTTDNFE